MEKETQKRSLPFNFTPGGKQAFNYDVQAASNRVITALMEEPFTEAQMEMVFAVTRYRLLRVYVPITEYWQRQSEARSKKSEEHSLTDKF